MITTTFKKITPIIFSVAPVLFFSCEENKSSDEKKITLSDESQSAPMEKKEELKGGAKYYYENCKVCHGADGKRQLAGAKDLSVSTISVEERIKQISEGKSKMPGFKNTLSDEQIKEVAHYLDELKK